ncbi:restriction endonuclease [Streptomyces sp. SP2-10]|uniref:restriction endonuclease n=1 Tax=Streptomyces sp. SP2-10 TaxID=2873385 RepID=UPI001CA6322A|nr:restriction endonuclease [Streptomyces sp. SP2-10]MBY8844588.1 restriction endonuclease [Streptomyces sp. SP2-10]
MTERIEQIYDRAIAEEKLKDGTKYERLTAIVFKILDDSGLVVHDVKLRGDGKEASHQIDVSAGYDQLRQRVLVECKDYGSESVGIDVIRDFNGALVQLQPVQGIVVTTTRFTSGACAYARDEGIALVQLRPFTDHDWNGRVRAVKITATLYTPGEATTTWEATGRVRPAPADAEESTSRVSVHDVSYYDASGTRLGPLHSLLADWHAGLSRATPTDGSTDTIAGHHQLEHPVWLRQEHELVEVTGFDWTAPVVSLDLDLQVTGSRIADLIAHAVQLPAAMTLTESLSKALGSPGTVVFHDQLARWDVDDDGVITPRPLI